MTAVGREAAGAASSDRCRYCGGRCRSGGVCHAHSDLPALDPAVVAEAMPATLTPTRLHMTGALAGSYAKGGPRA